ncbi:MAG: hypothetical protein IKH56_06645 [Oscillospiraceae bacterium]|nr:hypothetical protein [Oscillospiraceae bacterium]
MLSSLIVFCASSRLSIITLAFTKKQAEKTSKNKQTQKAADNKDKIKFYTETNGSASSSELSEILDLSAARIRVLLSELIEKGQLIPQGNGRSRRYYLSHVFL